jgi:hypothetical protein
MRARPSAMDILRMNERKSVLVRPEDVSPSSDEVEVVGVFNPGAVDADGVVHLLLRVAERPKEERPGWVALPAFGPAGRYEVEWVREQNVDRLDPRGVAFRRDGQHRLTTVSHLRLATSRDGRSIDWMSPSCKVSNPRFRGKVRKFSRHFKGHFAIGNVRVRILRGQPSSRGTGETTPETSRKAHNWRAFAICWTVSRLPNSLNPRPICRKSPAATANIPVFGRLAPETWFDRHWAARAAVKFPFSPVQELPYWAPSVMCPRLTVLSYTETRTLRFGGAPWRLLQRFLR